MRLKRGERRGLAAGGKVTNLLDLRFSLVIWLVSKRPFRSEYPSLGAAPAVLTWRPVVSPLWTSLKYWNYFRGR